MLAQGRREDEPPPHYIIYLQAAKRGSETVSSWSGPFPPSVENSVVAEAQDAHGSGTVQPAPVGLGFIDPLDTLGRHYLLDGKSSGLMPNSAAKKRAWPS